MIRKVKGGYVIVHCRKRGMQGKRIAATKHPVPYSKALAIHRAIMWRRYRKK